MDIRLNSIVRKKNDEVEMKVTFIESLDEQIIVHCQYYDENKKDFIDVTCNISELTVITN